MRTAELLAHESIRERAYELWDRHHRPEGYELHFWYLAERELRAERSARVDSDVHSDEPASAYEAPTA